MNPEAFEKVLKISEEFFGTESDPEQMPISQESADKLTSIHPDSIVYKFDDEGNPIAWAVVVPTSREVMDRFLNKEISEKELLDEAAKEKKLEALYLCAAFVLPEHRRKGIARELLIEAINKTTGKDVPMYCWIYSPEGEKLANSVSEHFNKPFSFRK